MRSGLNEPEGSATNSPPTVQAPPSLVVATPRRTTESGKARGWVTCVQASPSQWRIIGPEPTTPTAQTSLLATADTPVK